MTGYLVPPGATETYVRAAGARWRVLTGTWTDEPPTALLLLHGGGYDAAGISWYRALGALGADRRVVAPDLPGFGGSRDVPVLGDVAATADQVAGLLDAMGLRRVVVCGVSMGGDLALELALRHPGLVTGLVCVAPGGLISRWGSAVSHNLAWLATRGGPATMELISRASRPWVRRSLEGLVQDMSALPQEAVEEFVAEAYRERGGVAYGLYNKASIGWRRMRNDKTARVDRIEVPALFLHGDKDPAVPLSGSEKAAAAMPRAKLVLFGGCGHWVQLERSADFEAEVRAFLVECDL